MTKIILATIIVIVTAALAENHPLAIENGFGAFLWC